MVAVPKWLLIVVAALVGAVLLAGLGFAIGYEVAPGNEHGHERNAPEGLRPGSGGVPSVPGNGNGSDLPTVPPPAPTPGTSRGAFLGVATSPSANPPGVSIVRVVAGSPAATAGLQPGDVITKLDNDAITTQSQLANRIGAHGQGDAVTITYVRNGTTQTAPVTLAARNAFQLPTPSTTVPQS
jgi:S1-C subfamily serine protease